MKLWAKTDKAIQNAFLEKLKLFAENPKNDLLHDEPLGKRRDNWEGHRSIAVTGNFRAVYKLVEKDLAQFVAIGSHSELATG